MSRSRLVRFIFSIPIVGVLFLSSLFTAKYVYAWDYPSGCDGCRGEGGLCAHGQGGYYCATQAEWDADCGDRLWDTSACPSECGPDKPCGAYEWTSGSCADPTANKCIKVETCPGSAPTATPTNAPSGCTEGQCTYDPSSGCYGLCDANGEYGGAYQTDACNTACNAPEPTTTPPPPCTTPVSFTDDSGNNFSWQPNSSYGWYAHSTAGLINIDKSASGGISSFTNGPIDDTYNWHYTANTNSTPGSYTLEFHGYDGNGALCEGSIPFTLGPVSTPPTCTITGDTSVVASATTIHTYSDTTTGTNVTSTTLHRSSLAGDQAWETPPFGSGVTSATGSLTFPTAGTYAVVCNAFDAQGGQCSGNPWCWGEANPPANCAGSKWTDCKVPPYPPADFLTVSVTDPEGTIKAHFFKTSRSSPVCDAGTDFDASDLTSYSLFRSDGEDEGLGMVTGNDVEWANKRELFTDLYHLSVNPGTDYILAAGCARRNGATITYNDILKLTDNAGTDGDTLDWYLGFSPPGPWVQTGGGDVYASGNLQSPIPSAATTPLFSVNGASGYPGVALYGGASASFGGGAVSSKNWLAKDNYSTTEDFFTGFWRSFGALTTPTLANLDAKPASGVYYVKGPVTIRPASPWSVSSTESIVIFVDESSSGAGDGILTVDSLITVTPGGFLAFITKGGITVDSTVGNLGPPYSLTSDIEGVYITNGPFNFGNQSNKLVARGIFIASSFGLHRDLGDANKSDPAEIFTYRPDFLVSMPEEMREATMRWQEINP